MFPASAARRRSTRRTNRTSSPHTEIARVRTALKERPAPGLMASLRARGRRPARRGRGQCGDGQGSCGNFRRQPSATEDQRAMADALDFLEIGRNQQNRQSLAQRELKQMVDVRLRPDVDADGRLLENEQPDMRLHPARDHHLLLVSAGKRRHRLLDARRLDGKAPRRRVRPRSSSLARGMNSSTPLPLAAGFT